MSCQEATYRFSALEDFTEIDNFDKRELAALAYCVRIATYQNFEPKDIGPITGPTPASGFSLKVVISRLKFKFALKEMIFGFHNGRTLFIREVVIPPNSNIELHYYDIVHQQEYIAEIVRHPGLNLELRSGYHYVKRNLAHIICTRDGGVMIIDKDCKRRYVL